VGRKVEKTILIMYLLDTNVVINFLDASLPKPGMQLLRVIVDDNPCISVITKIEALGFNFQSANEQNTMEAFVSGSTVLNINDDIIEKNH
jgi:predicted nucleic acid-binding protein